MMMLQKILFLIKDLEIFKGTNLIVLSILNWTTMKIFISQTMFIAILGLKGEWVGQGRIFHDYSNIYKIHQIYVMNL